MNNLKIQKEKTQIPQLNPIFAERKIAQLHIAEIFTALEKMPKEEWLELARKFYVHKAPTPALNLTKLFEMLSEKTNYDFVELIKRYYLDTERNKQNRILENILQQRSRSRAQKISDLIFNLITRQGSAVKVIFANWDNYNSHHFDQQLFG
jgi:hypothetical protein